eukprot:scaffold21438_cov98-Skeletonema_dohrnii-CCMP3373.AAC.1
MEARRCGCRRNPSSLHSGDEYLRGRIGHRKTENDEGDADGGKRVRLSDGGLYDKIIICHPKKRVGVSFIATTTMFMMLYC